MRLLNYREGFASNSSSTHFTHFNNDMTEQRAMSQYGYRVIFSATGKEELLRYVGAQINANLDPGMATQHRKFIIDGLIGISVSDKAEEYAPTKLTLPDDQVWKLPRAKGGHGHAYGSVFSLKIPLISITPYWTHTIFRNYPGGFIGGVARATHIPMSDTTRIALFHAVSNMLCAPEEIKTMIFGSWLESLRPSSLLVKWGEEVDDIEKLYGCAHAWWGEFYWDLRFKIHKTEKLPIKVIYTSYPDGQMDRIMIVADGNGDTLDIANERTCAVTLQNDPPEFFDGKYRPTATEWRYICKWIELNRDLLCDIEFLMITNLSGMLRGSHERCEVARY